MLRLGFDPKVKRHAAQRQSYQHERDRQVQSTQDDAMGHWKTDQQHAHTQHQPGFVSVPKRANAGNHDVFLFH